MNAISANQGRTFQQLLAELRPFFRSDRNLPARIQQRLARERRFGSRDRRLYRELLYTAVRFLPWLEEREAISESHALEAVIALASPIPAVAPLKAGLTGPLAELPPTLVEKARVLSVQRPLVPDWTAEQCPAAAVSPNLDVLHTRAPLWLRLQATHPDLIFEEFRNRGWTWRASSVLPDAVEIMTDADVTSTDAFKHGRFEVQDLGSQLLLSAVAPEPGGGWLDACAGAGGKTLQLARLLGARGRVAAHDIRPAALEELSARAQRAALTTVSIVSRPSGLYDGVLVDAPCSGTGTWRRSPHLKWCTSAEAIQEAAQQQQTLLGQFAAHVGAGGRLIYATCSLCRAENEGVVESFLARHPDFVAEPLTQTFGGEQSALGLTFWPAIHNTDGFFVAALRRR